MRRMVELSRREMPAEVVDRLRPFEEDPAGLRAECIRIATQMCAEMLAGGAPGLHFYTLNRSKSTRVILEALSITTGATPRRGGRALPGGCTSRRGGRREAGTAPRGGG